MRHSFVRIVLGAAALAAAVLPALTQTPPAQRPSFEVASIKPNNSGSGNSGNSTGRGRYVATNVSVKMLMTSAYRVQSFQIIGGPGWMETDRWDIDARPEAGEIPVETGRRDPDRIDPMLLMVQSLLEDRFRLKLHRDTREQAIYTLTIAKDGPKVKNVTASTQDAVGAAAAGRGVPSSIANPSPGSTYTSISNGKAEMNSKGVPVSNFVSFLSRQMGRPVVDKTGLTGLFDFHLLWTPESVLSAAPAASEPSGLPSIFTAIQEQIGLKLESAKGPVEVLVIDDVQKPTEN